MSRGLFKTEKTRITVRNAGLLLFAVKDVPEFKSIKRFLIVQRHDAEVP
jgi:hypothetical protein